ncbi:MAG TPA: response regulator transcription factor [Xanthobacteraceae bacterium]|nr:response regulator transcription factor [Xanthobacteraceae bacterium]
MSAVSSSISSRGSSAHEERPVVFVIDDDPSVREALDSLFRSVAFKVGFFGSAQEFLDAERPDAPGCIVLDVRLPGRSGLDFQRDLIKSGIHLPVIFITGHGDIPMSARAFKAGAIEFLTKPFRDQELLDAVALGIRQDRARREELSRNSELRKRYESLTPREREVMACITAGRSNKEAAAELKLSVVTVKVHRGHVMQKMQAKSLADLVRMADRLQAVAERFASGGTQTH